MLKILTIKIILKKQHFFAKKEKNSLAIKIIEESSTSVYLLIITYQSNSKGQIQINKKNNIELAVSYDNTFKTLNFLKCCKSDVIYF